MCVAMPGTVISLMDDRAEVDFDGNTVVARTGLVDVKIGDKVLVHAGCILQKMKEDEAKELADILREVNSLE
jgi:hydrogenase expression/formation protein HypC